MKALIVLPTYNERENLSELVDTILKQQPAVDVLIVDDQSPDGTGDVADQLSEHNERVLVMHRMREPGRGAAVRDGILYAVKYQYECVVEMDADFSHDPAFIPHFIAALERFDVVVGSRFVQGGSIEGVGQMRSLVSRASNYAIRVILGLPVKDATCDFRGYSTRVFEDVDVSLVKDTGFTFGIELLYHIFSKGHPIREIPIVFGRRRSGEPKNDWRMMLGYPRQVLALRRRLWRL